MLATRIIHPAASALCPLRRSCKRVVSAPSRRVAAIASVQSGNVGGGGGRSWSRGTGAGSRGKRMRGVVGGIASLATAATLAKERLYPDLYFDWDDQVEWEEVHQLAQMSNMTNKPASVVRKWFGRHGYNGHVRLRDLPELSSRYWVHTGHAAGQEENDRMHHVAVRGTVSLSDLNTNFKTNLVMDQECGCRLHAGFKEVADAMADDIEQFLEPSVPIKLAGHSMGGAVAVILAMKLKARGYNVAKVMTFGSPKVTDAPGAERLRGVLPVLRVTHERDPVPLMPVADWAIPLPKSSRRRSVADSHRGVWMTDEQPQGVTVDSPRQQDGVTNPRQRHTCAVHPREEAEVNDRPHRLEVAESISRHVEVDVEGLNDSRRSFLDGGGRANAHPESSDGPRRSGMGDGRGRKMFTPSAAYSHFGSQLVLVRRKACLECRREASTSSSPMSSSFPQEQRRRHTRLAGSWDDVWGPDPAAGGTQLAVSGDGDDLLDEQKDCGHCPSRGKTYYDPTGDDGCLFDRAWLRLANFDHLHRMNHYEREIAERRNHHFMRDKLARDGALRGDRLPASDDLELELEVDKGEHRGALGGGAVVVAVSGK